MKTIFTFLLSIALQSQAWSGADDKQESIGRVQTIKEGVRMEVWCARSFPTNRDVEISYILANESKVNYWIVSATALYDVKIEITGPDGKRIKGYQEIEGGDPRGVVKMYVISDFAPGDSGDRNDGLSIPLSVYWPLKQVGEYRFVLKRTIFRNDGRITTRGSEEPGVPFVLVSPELRFTIESIDHSYVSPLDQAAKNRERSQWGEEAIDQPGWGIYEYSMLGVTAAAFLFLGYTIRKRSKVATQVF